MVVTMVVFAVGVVDGNWLFTDVTLLDVNAPVSYIDTYRHG